MSWPSEWVKAQMCQPQDVSILEAIGGLRPDSQVGCAVQGCIANCLSDRSIAWASTVNLEANCSMTTKDAAPYKPVVLLWQLVAKISVLIAAHMQELAFDVQMFHSDDCRMRR